jgi:hypothetical protein
MARVRRAHQDRYLIIPVSARDNQTLVQRIYIGLGYIC